MDITEIGELIMGFSGLMYVIAGFDIWVMPYLAVVFGIGLMMFGFGKFAD